MSRYAKQYLEAGDVMPESISMNMFQKISDINVGAWNKLGYGNNNIDMYV